jgi:hypothetical protein
MEEPFLNAGHDWVRMFLLWLRRGPIRVRPIHDAITIGSSPVRPSVNVFVVGKAQLNLEKGNKCPSPEKWKKKKVGKKAKKNVSEKPGIAKISEKPGW